jgi:hypothetical protein
MKKNSANVALWLLILSNIFSMKLRADNSGQSEHSLGTFEFNAARNRITEMIDSAAGKRLTNQDSIFRLPLKEYLEWIKNAGKRPTELEVATDTIRSVQDLYKLHVFGFYSRQLNLILLRKYIFDGDPDKEESRAFINIINGMNREMFFKYVHESDHGRKLRKINLAWMNLYQYAELDIHIEYSAEIAVAIERRREFIETGSIEKAFPLASEAYRKDMPKNEYDKTANLMKTPKFWLDTGNKEAQKLKRALLDNFAEWYSGPLHFRWLLENYENLETDRMSSEEADIIMKDVMNGYDNLGYLAQAAEVASGDLLDGYYMQQDILYDEEKPDVQNFDSVIHDIVYEFGGESFLDNISEKMIKEFQARVNKHKNNKELKKKLAYIEKNFPDQIKFAADFHAMFIGPQPKAPSGAAAKNAKEISR